jgi:RND family efflux transporter MFP subunit
MGKLFALGVGLIYLILATQFRSYWQPLIILLTVPLAFTGVVLGLLVSGNPLSLYTLYGVIALTGIAVNSAIVLIDAANERRGAGMSVQHAAIYAARRRVVPILITSTTTIGGLLSLAIGLGGKSLMWGPVAASIVWGLGFSTVLTLFAVPLLYWMFMRRFSGVVTMRNFLPPSASMVLLLAACSEAPPPPAPRARLVRTLKVGAGDTAIEWRRSGATAARYAPAVETTLGFRIAGKIVERRVDVGQAVKAGQVLARLDPADSALQLAQAEAQHALAAADLARYRDLRTKNFVSASALDARETAFKAAAAQAQLAKNQAGYATLAAERNGVVSQVLAEAGQVVGAGQAVFRLAPDGEREVAISIPESEIGAFKPGQAATVRFWATAGAADRPVAGRLREVSPMADPVTRTFAARISLQDADPLLPLGMTATVRFPNGTGGASALFVPLTAIFQQGNQPAVWIVGADNTVKLQPVSVRPTPMPAPW